MVASFLAAQRPPVRNASMTSANDCGVLRVWPSRTLVVTCADCFRGQGLVASRLPPNTSAMAPGIALLPLRATALRTQVLDVAVAKPLGQVASEITGTVVGQQPGSISGRGLIEPAGPQRQVEGGGDILGPHIGAQFPGHDAA